MVSGGRRQHFENEPSSLLSHIVSSPDYGRYYEIQRQPVLKIN